MNLPDRREISEKDFIGYGVIPKGGKLVMPSDGNYGQHKSTGQIG